MRTRKPVNYFAANEYYEPRQVHIPLFIPHFGHLNYEQQLNEAAQSFAAQWWIEGKISLNSYLDLERQIYG